MAAIPAHADERPPWLGEHTSAVLRAELGLGAGELDALRADGVIA